MPGTDALVATERPVRRLDDEDLLVEQSLIGCGRGALVRRHRERVQILTTESPPRGDHLGADALRHEAVVVPRLHHWPERAVAADHAREHRHPRHDLDATGDHDVLLTGDHRRGRHVQGLLARSALPVDRHPGDVLGQTRRQRGIARDIERLLADLRDAAEHDIVDELRIDTGPANRLIDDERRQIHGMDVAQCTTVRLADTHGGAHGADDDCIAVRHWSPLPGLSMIGRP